MENVGRLNFSGCCVSRNCIYEHHLNQAARPCGQTRVSLSHTITETLHAIKNKIYTHSLHGFIIYIKICLLNNYSDICTLSNCCICQLNCVALSNVVSVVSLYQMLCQLCRSIKCCVSCVALSNVVSVVSLYQMLCQLCRSIKCCVYIYIYIYTYIYRASQPASQTDRQTDIQANRQTYRQTDKERM